MLWQEATFRILIWISTGTVYGTLSIEAEKAELEVNVGNTISLTWKYVTGGQNYDAILWGKADDLGINFKKIYYFKRPRLAGVNKSASLDQNLASRIRFSGGSSLIISNVQLSDEGYYICEIRTSFITAKEKIYLTVYGE